MQHPDEHTLELYVLGSAKVTARKQEIEDHLAQCFGCREMVERMSEFYQDVKADLAKQPAPTEDRSDALVEMQKRIIRTPEPDFPAIPLRRVTRIQRFQYFVRQHPVMTGGGTFAALAGLAMLLNTTTTFFKEDGNPELIRYNIAENRIEILDKKYQTLWDFPQVNVDGLKSSASRGQQLEIAVFDLDSDGKNEILSSLPLPMDEMSQTNPFRVLDGSGNIVRSVSFDREVRWGQRVYESVWNAGMFAIDSSNRSEPSILLLWNCGRSPTVVTRLNRKLEVVGEYWHFGGIMGMRMLDLNNDGKGELIITGQNEALDSVHGEFPAFVVLDPLKITGRGKSTATTGFAMPESKAELFYVGLPTSSIATILDAHETVAGIWNVGPKFFSGVVHGVVYENVPSSFEYLFTRDMRLVEVKSSNASDIVYRALVADGKAQGGIDAAYLANLKDGVRYWDGKVWRKEPVSVNARNVKRDEESNPSYYLYNPSSRAIEIRSSTHKKLWELPSKFVTQRLVDWESQTSSPQTAVVDLDGDGYNEVVTILPLGSNDQQNELRIYDAWKNLKLEREFDKPFKYLNRDYSPQIYFGSILVGDFTKSGKKEIWISGNSFNRSPTVIMRLDAKANMIGTYWHFGQIYGMQALDLENDGTIEIVVAGANDTEDTNHHEFAALSILDPTKVVGETRSTTAPGFVVPVSTAESYYISFPYSDMDTVLQTHPILKGVKSIGTDALHIFAGSSRPGTSIAFQFEYILRRDLTVREVKSNNETDLLHENLVKQGKLKGRIDHAYLGRLKNGVRYWDGKEWRKEVVRVAAKPQLTIGN